MISWKRWQLNNWEYWLAAVLALVFLLLGFSMSDGWDWGLIVWVALFSIMLILAVYKGIIKGWKNYRNGKNT